MNTDMISPLIPSPSPIEPDNDTVPLDYNWTRDETSRQNRIRRLARLAFPSYRGRKFRLDFSSSYQMQNYWDGGTRYFAMAVNLRTNEISHPSKVTTNPFQKEAHAEVGIPKDFGILEHCIFCGKSLGIRLILPPLESKESGKAVEI